MVGNNEMLRIKNKMHKIVNLIFYFIVFLLGFILGGGNNEKIKDIFINLFS